MKSNGTESAATATPRGLELDMASLSISSPAPTGAAIPSKIVNGDAAEKTDATRDAITRARSSHLSDGQLGDAMAAPHPGGPGEGLHGERQ